MPDTMQVDIYNVEQPNDRDTKYALSQCRRTIEHRNIDLRTVLGDDVDELPRLMTDLQRNGLALFGGGATPLYEIKPVRMDDQRRAFNETAERAIDRAHGVLEPLFDPAYQVLESWEMEILHELIFKLHSARSIIVHRDMLPDTAEHNYQRTKASRAAVLERRKAL